MAAAGPAAVHLVVVDDELVCCECSAARRAVLVARALVEALGPAMNLGHRPGWPRRAVRCSAVATYRHHLFPQPTAARRQFYRSALKQAPHTAKVPIKS